MPALAGLLLECGQVPEAHGPIQTAGSDYVAVRRARDRIDLTTVPFQRSCLARVDIPYLHQPVVTGRGQPVAARRQRKGLNRALMSLKRRNDFALLQVPQTRL